MSESIADRMDLLERRANVARSRLANAVSALDARRHRVAKIGKQATALAPLALGALGVGAIAIGYLILRRPPRLRTRVADAMEEIGLLERPSFWRRALERTVLAAVSVGVAEVARRAAKNAFDGRLLDGRLAVGGALHAHHEES